VLWIELVCSSPLQSGYLSGSSGSHDDLYGASSHDDDDDADWLVQYWLLPKSRYSVQHKIGTLSRIAMQLDSSLGE